MSLIKHATHSISLGLFIALLSAGSLRADAVLSEIDAAKKAYESGDAAEASAALNQALALIGEQKSGAIGKALPDQIGEWTGGEIENQSAGMAVLGGGGVMLNRPYTMDEQSLTINLSADSPLMASFAGMVTNPAMGAAMGMKMHRLGDQKVMINEKDGTGVMIYKNRFLIQIQDTKLSAEELVKLFGGIDLAVLDAVK